MEFDITRLTRLTRLSGPILALAIGLTACGQPRTGAPDPTPEIKVTYHPTPTALAPAVPPADVPASLPEARSDRQPLLIAAAIDVAQTMPVPEPAPTVASASAPAYVLPGPSAMLTGLRHERQTWNNCGPATIAMLLSRFGRAETQREAAQFLKPDPDDKNVSPDELVAYAQSLGFEARVVVGGDLEMLRTLVANGLPVIVETWFIPKPGDEMGHYQLVVGYDEGTFALYDSYEGPNIREQADVLDGLWKVFNRTAVVVWLPEHASLVRAILAERWADQPMFDRALARAQAELSANPQDKYAWFNSGSSLLALGDSAGAAHAFDQARALKLPWRMMWYQFGPYAAYFEQGRHRDVIDLANVTLGRVRNLEESLYWRGLAYRAIGSPAAARRDFEQALRFNPHYIVARNALAALRTSS
jgi:tetratricopeptide (TPR) repeat protein